MAPRVPTPKLSPEARAGIARRRRWSWGVGLHTAFALVLAAGVAGMLHYLSARHYVRRDLSRTQFYALSDKTRSLLASVTNRLEVTVLFQSKHELLPDVEALLQEYRSACPPLRVTRVDPDRDVARVESLSKKYPVTDANVVIFDGGGRFRIVGRSDLADFDYAGAARGRPPVMRAFKGEQAFSSAINAVTHARTPVVYVLIGHGERPLDSFDRGTGLAQLARLIRQDNVEVRPLLLGAEKSVPADADALIVAGPRKRFAAAELDLIGQYLERNGRAVFLLESQTATGLEALLARWGIAVGDDLVMDPARSLGGGIVVSRFGRHAITEHIHDLASVFYLPRSVEPAVTPAVPPAEAADRPHVSRLAMTSESGWAEKDLAQKPFKYDAGMDLPGPVGIAVAAERGPVPGLDMEIRPTRLVVFGDCNFVANGGLVSGNGDLFMSALNWVLDRKELMAIAPKAVAEMRLDLSARQMKRMGWAAIAGLPSLVAVCGLLVWWRRRS